MNPCPIQRLVVAIVAPLALMFQPGPPAPARRRWSDDRGQATTEYALVLLAAALVAVLVITWATAGGGAAKVGQLFDAAIDSVIDKL